MKGGTEYRDSYCWVFGGRKQTGDSYEDIIKQKIAGTYIPEVQKREVPRFDFEIQAETQNIEHNEDDDIETTTARTHDRSRRKKKLGRSTSPSASSSGPLSQRIKKGPVREDFLRRAKRGLANISANKTGTDRAPFENYGRTNNKPTHEGLFMATHNVGSQTGVYPAAFMRTRVRNQELEHQRRLAAERRAKKPVFYAKQTDAPDDIDVAGPFWVMWPSDEPFPDKYAQLEDIVRRE